MNEKELRELDAWIAENIFRWHRQKFDNGYSKQNLLVDKPFKPSKYRKHGFYEGIPLQNSFPRYSTDPAAAMQVLERCCVKIGPNPQFSISIREREDDFWEVFTQEVSHSATTLPVAICLFAQKLFRKP